MLVYTTVSYTDKSRFTRCNKQTAMYEHEYIKFLIPLHGGGEVFKSVGEEYQVVKKGNREYYGRWKEYNIEKRERGININFPISRLLVKTSSGEEGKGTEILRKKIAITKMGVGKNIKM